MGVLAPNSRGLTNAWDPLTRIQEATPESMGLLNRNSRAYIEGKKCLTAIQGTTLKDRIR